MALPAFKQLAFSADALWGSRLKGQLSQTDQKLNAPNEEAEPATKPFD